MKTRKSPELYYTFVLPIDPSLVSQKCKECGKIKPLGQFSKHHLYQSGHRTTCKACCKEYAKEYAQGKKVKEAQSLIAQAEHILDSAVRVEVGKTSQYTLQALQQATTKAQEVLSKLQALTS